MGFDPLCGCARSPVSLVLKLKTLVDSVACREADEWEPQTYSDSLTIRPNIRRRPITQTLHMQSTPPSYPFPLCPFLRLYA